MSARLVHLGLGNFHRAHQAVYTEDAAVAAGPWRITGVSFRNRELVAAMRAQDGRYTLLEVGPGASAPRTVSVVDRCILAADEPEQVVAAIADPSTTTVTLTVTEQGYSYRPGTRDLDTDDPGIRRDAAGHDSPATMLGLLAAGLLQRAEHGTPIDLVACDNVGGNGTGLRTVLGQYAELLPAPRAAVLHQFLTSVRTPDTMVDRIVPATSPAHRRAAAAAGFADRVPVPAEPFSMWVLADDFAAPRPAWESAGAVVGADVAGYELVKLRLVNATHSMLAYLGLLTGHRYIADAVADPALRALALDGLGEEMVATIAPPRGLDVDGYRAGVSERFANHELGHTCQQVGSDGSLKLTQRVPDPVAWHAARGHVPDCLALLTAAWLRTVAYAGDTGVPDVDQPREPARERLRELARRTTAPRRLAGAVLVDEAVLGPVPAAHPEYVDRVGELLHAFTTHPAATVVASAAARYVTTGAAAGHSTLVQDQTKEY